MRRRQFLRSAAAAPLIATPLIEIVTAQAPPPAQAPPQGGRGAQGGRGGQGAAPAQPYPPPPAKPRQKIKQSVMASVWRGILGDFEEQCKILQRIGFKGRDLPSAANIAMMKQYGLAPTMMTGTGTSMQDGFMRKELHDAQEAACRTGIDTCAASGCENLIGFAGAKRGMSPAEAADNTVAIWTRLKPYAEQKNVNICLEITNSRVAGDQRTDMVFDNLAWGIDVCKRMNSPRFKIVYDMYHVQISDGDLTRNMLENLQYICHMHVAGVPTRGEIDDTQEVNWRFIANAIATSGYTGYVAHEWYPTPGRDPMKSLEDCFKIMDV
jgi:hydroxypyruvate isomerase